MALPASSVSGTSSRFNCSSREVVMSWDSDAVLNAGRVTAVEASCTGLHWTFSPVLDLARDLRWGRIGETFGEDLLLASILGEALIRGYQGENMTDATSILAPHLGRPVLLALALSTPCGQRGTPRPIDSHPSPVVSSLRH